MIRLIIAGSRDFDDYELLKQTCDYMLQNHVDVEIVSGKANGADRYGEAYAKERGYKVTEFPADWKDFGKPRILKTNDKGERYNAMAGIKRNRSMAIYADALIAFWNGKSPGTKNMIEEARKRGLKVKIVKY